MISRLLRKAAKKNRKKTHNFFWRIKFTLYICTPENGREFSSAGSEHLPYKQRVTGSNPVIPTSKALIRGLFLCSLNCCENYDKLNKRLAFSVVSAAVSSNVFPIDFAMNSTVCAMNAGSFLFPRLGTGDKNGASVSTTSFSNGIF